MSMIVLDTNIVIAYLGADEGVKTKIREALTQGDKIAVPTVVVAEILAYPEIDEQTLTHTRQWLSEISVLVCDLETAERAAEIRRATKMKLVDSIVAANALQRHASLASRDKEFQKVPELTLLIW